MDLSFGLGLAHFVVGRPLVLELIPRRDQFRVSSVRAAEDEVACVSLPAAANLEENLIARVCLEQVNTSDKKIIQVLLVSHRQLRQSTHSLEKPPSCSSQGQNTVRTIELSLSHSRR